MRVSPYVHRARRLGCAWLALAIWLCSAAAWAWSEERPPLRREGLVMGLDPGLVLRHVDDEWKLFARLNLRFAGCIGPRVQMGVDWRMEIFTAGQGSNVPNRHEIGPVLTVFAHKGWFFRFYSHVGALHPFRVTVGAGTGYEWSLGRFTGMGVAVGGDVDILFTGAPPPAQAVFVVWHLSAYDLKTRRGRED